MSLDEDTQSKMVAAYLRWHRLCAEAPAMLALLRELEFADCGRGGRRTCGMCFADKGEPHEVGCRMAAMLTRIDGVGKEA